MLRARRRARPGDEGARRARVGNARLSPPARASTPLQPPPKNSLTHRDMQGGDAGGVQAAEREGAALVLGAFALPVALARPVPAASASRASAGSSGHCRPARARAETVAWRPTPASRGAGPGPTLHPPTTPRPRIRAPIHVVTAGQRGGQRPCVARARSVDCQHRELGGGGGRACGAPPSAVEHGGRGGAGRRSSGCEEDGRRRAHSARQSGGRGRLPSDTRPWRRVRCGRTPRARAAGGRGGEREAARSSGARARRGRDHLLARSRAATLSALHAAALQPRPRAWAAGRAAVVRVAAPAPALLSPHSSRRSSRGAHPSRLREVRSRPGRAAGGRSGRPRRRRLAATIADQTGPPRAAVRRAAPEAVLIVGRTAVAARLGRRRG